MPCYYLHCLGLADLTPIYAAIKVTRLWKYRLMQDVREVLLDQPLTGWQRPLSLLSDEEVWDGNAPCISCRIACLTLRQRPGRWANGGQPNTFCWLKDDSQDWREVILSGTETEDATQNDFEFYVKFTLNSQMGALGPLIKWLIFWLRHRIKMSVKTH